MDRVRIYGIAFVLFILAFLVLAHQFIVYDKIFELDQILHHETLALFLMVFGIIIIMVNRGE